MSNSNKHQCLQDGPWSKRLRSARSLKADENPIGDLTRPPNKSRALTINEGTQKLAKLVENHPQLNSTMEEMLEDISTKLESEVSTVVKRQKNEKSSAIYKLSTDSLKLCFGFLGEDQYYSLQVRRIGSNKSMMASSEIRNEPASIVLQ